MSTWTPLSKSADQLVSSEPAVLALAGNANRFTNQVPQLQAQLNEVVRAMSASGAPSSQIYNALQQVVVSGTMARRVTAMRAVVSGAGGVVSHGSALDFGGGGPAGFRGGAGFRGSGFRFWGWHDRIRCREPRHRGVCHLKRHAIDPAE